MQIAHKRAADSFISLHAKLDDLPLSVSIDVNLAPLASLIGIGNGGGNSAVTSSVDIHTITTTTDHTTAVEQSSSEVSQAAATPTTEGGGGGGDHGGGVTQTISVSSAEGPFSTPQATGNSFTFTSATTTRLKQEPTTNGDGSDVLIQVEPSPSVTTTLTRISRPSDGAVISFGTPISLVNTPSGVPSDSLSTTVTTYISSGNPTSDVPSGPSITQLPPDGGSHGRLSPGAIAGIVIALIIMLTGVFIFIYRRRRAYRRDQAVLGWNTSRSSYQYQDEASPRFQDVFRRFTMPAAHRGRASFNDDTAILSPPPMAEYARSERSSKSAASSLPASLDFDVPTRSLHRHSASVASVASAGTIQSLLVDVRELSVNGTSAPMSAPPFSSSKSFVLSNHPRAPIPTIRISPAPSPKSLFIPSYRPIAVDLPPIPPLPSSPPPLPPSSKFVPRDPFEDPPG